MSALPSLIAESRLRSQRAGVDPERDHAEWPGVEPGELAMRRAEQSDLLDAAVPHLEHASSLLGADIHASLLDRDGVVLATAGPDVATELAWGLVPGADRSEQVAGTTGAGAALVLGQAVRVQGRQHFRVALHGATSVGAPVRDPAGGIGGAIELTVPASVHRDGDVALVTFVARAIEREWQLRLDMRDVEVLDAVANLDRVSEAALQYLAIDDLLRHVLRRVRRMFNADAGAILLVTEDGRFLTVRAAHGLEADESEGTVPIGTGIAGQIAEGRKPVVLNQVADGGAAVPTGKIRSLLGAPLIADDRLVGIVHVGTHQPRRFTEDEARLLELVADRVALGVDRARRYEDEQRARIDAEAGSRAAEAAGKARDEFLAILSHELRTPLTPIVGWARLLRGGVADGVAVRRAAESIERNALFLSRLIDDLLDVPRMMQTGLSLHVERIDPAAPVRAAVESLRAAAEEKGVALDLTLAGPPGPLTADPDRLQQVVRNLLSNAVKFTPSGGRIGVELARVGDAVEIRVIDTGQGIGADFLPHIFDRFSQEDCATPARTGLGLGLAIVQHIVERHGGTVRADSAGRGRGATFTVRLPVR